MLAQELADIASEQSSVEDSPLEETPAGDPGFWPDFNTGDSEFEKNLGGFPHQVIRAAEGNAKFLVTAAGIASPRLVENRLMVGRAATEFPDVFGGGHHVDKEKDPRLQGR